MIFTEQTSANTVVGSSTGTIPRIGLALYIRVDGVKADLHVDRTSYKDDGMVLSVTNSGKATARPRVEWTLEKAGETVASNKGLKTSFDTITVIAEGKRNIELKSPDLSKLAAGSYRLTGTLFWGEQDENNLSFDQSLSVAH